MVVIKRSGSEIAGSARIEYTGDVAIELRVTITIDNVMFNPIVNQTRVWQPGQQETVSGKITTPDVSPGSYDAICEVSIADTNELVRRITIPNEVIVESSVEMNRLMHHIEDNFNKSAEGCISHLDLNGDGIINVIDLATATQLSESQCKEISDAYEACSAPTPGDWKIKSHNYTGTGGTINIIREGQYIHFWTSGDWDIPIPNSERRTLYVGNENYRFARSINNNPWEIFERNADSSFSCPSNTNIEIHTRF